MVTEKSKPRCQNFPGWDRVRDQSKRDLTQEIWCIADWVWTSYLKTQGFKDKKVDKERNPSGWKVLRLAELSERNWKIDASRDEIQEQINFFKQQYSKDKKILEQFDNPNVHRDIANRIITKIKPLNWLN